MPPRIHPDQYQGSDQANVHIPNTSDFIKAGVITSKDKVYITKDSYTPLPATRLA